MGRFAATGTPPAEEEATATGETAPAPVPEVSDDGRKVAAFQKAAEDERHKRQEIEKAAQKAAEEAAYWRGKAEAAATNKEAAAPAEDPDLEWITSPSKKMQTALEAAKWETKVEVTRTLERDKHEDFDEKEAIFGQQRRLNPTIADNPEFKQNPARFAYKWATEFLKPKDSGSAPDALTAKIAELEKTIADLRGGSTTASIPQTQAGARSVASDTAPESNEDWVAEATAKRGGKRPF